MQQVLWFKRDLRLDDHAALALASRSGDVHPLLVVEPGYWDGDDTSERQYRWWSSSAQWLAHAIADQGGVLDVRVGDVIEALDDLLGRYGSFRLVAHQETGNWWTYQRDKAVRAWCAENGIEFIEPMQFGIWRGSSLDRDRWAKMWDAFMAKPIAQASAIKWSKVQPAETLPEPDALGLDPDGIDWLPESGTDAADEILRAFLYERGRDYRTDMSSPTLGAVGCSRLSPYLAVGAISMKRCFQATTARLDELKADNSADAKAWKASLRAYIGRLHWHCHFIQKLETDPELEWRPAVRAYEGMRPASDPALLQAFALGRTGYPFVDACMRQLASTGWINFRMRAMLMSFACYDLFLRWQDAGQVLARLFTDYDPGIHWTQAQMQSGESGINTLRIYNPVKQGRDHAANGAYMLEWVAELASCDEQAIHEPWKHDCAVDYVDPIVDHASAVKEARRRIYEVRRKPHVRAEAEEVLRKLGSRRRPRTVHNTTTKRSRGK